MQGILIVNQFLKTAKFNEIYSWLYESANRFGINLSMRTNADYLVRIDNKPGSRIVPDFPKCDFVLFWDKDVSLAKAIEDRGIRVFNSSQAIRLCDDKALTFEALLGQVKMPKTFRVPLTFSGVGYTNTDFLKLVEAKLSYPYILKENCGSFGYQVHLIDSFEKAVQILSLVDGRGCIVEEYIGNRPGEDIRIHTVGNRVVTAMLRKNTKDFRANITGGGVMEKIEITGEQEEMALKVTKLLGLDYAGVDILFGDNDEPVLCEVNSNAHFRNIYDCTKVNVADAIMEYIAAECRKK